MTTMKTTKTDPRAKLLKDAHTVLAMDFQESNDIVHRTVKGLLKALGESTKPAVRKSLPIPATIMSQALEADRVMNGPTVATDLSNRTSIGDVKVKGDRATYKIKDVIDCVDDASFNIAEDVGYGSINNIAALIMDQLNLRFGVRMTICQESDSREGGLFVEFEPSIPEERYSEYETFLGQA